MIMIGHKLFCCCEFNERLNSFNSDYELSRAYSCTSAVQQFSVIIMFLEVLMTRPIVSTEHYDTEDRTSIADITTHSESCALLIYSFTFKSDFHCT